MSAARAPAEGRPRLSAVGVLALLAGATAGVKLRGIGELYGCELALPLAALIALGLPNTGGIHWTREFRVLLALAAAMLLGYVIADLAAGTAPQEYLRGWARVIAIASSAAALGVLLQKDAHAFWWFAVGSACGLIGGQLASGASLGDSDAWKLGYSTPLSLLAAASAAFLPVALVGPALSALGVYSLLRDNRALGMLTLMTAALLLAGRLRARARAVGALAAAGVLVAAAAVGVVAVRYSHAEFESRQAISNFTRFTALRVGAEAIVDNPLLGYGSWGTGTEEYAERYYEQASGTMIGLSEAVFRRGDWFSPHSQLLQAWMEGGLLAGAFFLCYAFAAARQLRRLAVQRRADPQAALLGFVLLNGLWHTVMSPFAGFTRIFIVWTLGAIALVSWRGATAAVPAASSPERGAHKPPPPRFNIVRP